MRLPPTHMFQKTPLWWKQRLNRREMQSAIIAQAIP